MSSVLFTELSALLVEISHRETPEFLKKNGMSIFSEVLPGENPVDFQSVKIKLDPSLSLFSPLFSPLLEFPNDFSEMKVMRFFLEEKLLPIIQLKNSIKIKTLHEINEAEIAKIFTLINSIGSVKVSWDESGLGRRYYPTESGYWAGLSGYWSGVRKFYKHLHQLLIDQLKFQIIRNDLSNIVIWDLGCGTGKLIQKLLKELGRKSSELEGRVLKIVGIDLSKENIRMLHESCLKVVAKKPRTKKIAIEGRSVGVDQLDHLVIEPGENLICLTSGGLTRHVMPFLVAYRAFQIMQAKGCQLFIGGGLEPVWLNYRIAKYLGFKFHTTEVTDFNGLCGRDEGCNFGSKRLIILEKIKSPSVAEKDSSAFDIPVAKSELSPSRPYSLLSEETGYFEKAFSNAFLFRVRGEALINPDRIQLDNRVDCLNSSVSVSSSD